MIPSGPAAPSSTPEEQYDILGQLGAQGGLDPDALRELGEEKLDEGPVAPGATPPGYGASVLDLDEDDGVQLAQELCGRLDDYDVAMEPRWLVEEDIRSAYAQRPDPRQGGIRPGDSRLVSEITMVDVDQATARLSSMVMSVSPIVVVDPIAGEDGFDIASDAAKSAEAFLENYLRRGVRIDSLLPRAIHRTCKLGTAVIKGSWKVTKRRTFHYTKTSDKAQEKVEEKGDVCFELIPNRHVKIWPPSAWDWQEDYEFVGHDSWMTRSQWRELAGNLAISQELTDEVEATAGWDRDQGGDKLAKEKDIDSARMNSRADELIRVTELWAHMALPDEQERDRYQIFLSRPLRKVIWISLNRFHSQKHPYFPIRYKAVDELAWGDGIGHEVLFPQASDSAMQNIRMDALMAGCYNFVVRKPDSVHQNQTNRPMHGQVVYSDDPGNDFITRSLGGQVAGIDIAMEDAANRAARATGQSPVLSGLGDPTQKSGTGTGATVALIEQAGKKFGHVDSTIRADLTPLWEFTLEAVAQFAPEGMYYEYADAADAQRLKILRYVPIRGEVSKLFKLTATAPNASTSRDARRQSWLLLYQFLRDHLQVWGQQALQLLQTQNPAAAQRLTEDMLRFQAWLAQQLVEDYELPGAKDKIPQMPQALPQDEQMNQLTQQLQQLAQQLQQAQQQLQQAQQEQQHPTESIKMTDLPPKGKAMMAQQAGLQLDEADFGGVPAPESSDMSQGMPPGPPLEMAQQPQGAPS